MNNKLLLMVREISDCDNWGYEGVMRTVVGHCAVCRGWVGKEAAKGAVMG